MESGSEGEDLPPGQVCVEGKKEKQEQPPPLYHQLIMQAAQTLEIEMPAEQGRSTSCFDDEGVGQSPPLLLDLEEVVLRQFVKLSEAHCCSGLCRQLA